MLYFFFYKTQLVFFFVFFMRIFFRHIRKSRYDSIDSYLETQSKIYNDVKLEINEEVKSMLLEAGWRYCTAVFCT